jgi:hypothetical protein
MFRSHLDYSHVFTAKAQFPPVKVVCLAELNYVAPYGAGDDLMEGYSTKRSRRWRWGDATFRVPGRSSHFSVFPGQPEGWTPTLPAFRQVEELAGLDAVGAGFEVAVAGLAHGDDDRHGVALGLDVKTELAAVHGVDGFLLCNEPAGAVGVPAANGEDALEGIVAVGLVDEIDLVELCHRVRWIDFGPMPVVPTSSGSLLPWLPLGTHPPSQSDGETTIRTVTGF